MLVPVGGLGYDDPWDPLCPHLWQDPLLSFSTLLTSLQMLF